jgi:hypothetical protein
MSELDQQPPLSHRNPDAGLSDLLQQEHAVARPLAGTIQYGDADEETGEVDQRAIYVGTSVFSQDGEKLGEVVGLTENALIVEQGFFNPRDLYVPFNVITRHDESALHLRLTRDEFDASDWTTEPSA